MSSLPQADRELLAMCALEDLSTDDLAEILDVRPDAAKARLSRARARLRSAVEQLEQGDHEGRLP
jgi:RNA polymerase sigma-70 factor, ECF subfamily